MHEYSLIEQSLIVLFPFGLVTAILESIDVLLLNLNLQS